MPKDPAKTPAKPDERISGSSRNPRGSASGTRGGISIDEKTETALRNKVEEHNEKNTNASQKATLGQLKAVYRKLGVTRQAELARVLVATPTPHEGDRRD